eukprot:12023304-Prorocentrum_lima.AAC.1
MAESPFIGLGRAALAAWLATVVARRTPVLAGRRTPPARNLGPNNALIAMEQRVTRTPRQI